ncbi:gamma-mobile-trio recombinase GmtY [Paraburkholderia sp. BR13444]|uniref:gamma-mobile-trio recombinase GmtY n=1 Tax=Paraburkholderia sp. BR13444 TaxID=3236997 RepID=UPI0034CF4733
MIPLSVVKGRIRFDSTGVAIELPVLLTPYGILSSLLEYFLWRDAERSHSWMRKVARAVLLFLEYISVNLDAPNDYRIFVYFSKTLATGSLDPATGEDIRGLGWRALNQQERRKVVQRLTEYFEYLENPDISKLNPRFPGSSFDRKVEEAAYLHRRERAFLGHTWKTPAEWRGAVSRPMVRGARPSKAESGQPPAFPDGCIMRLLFEGFRVGNRLNYRDMLITLLLHGAGFRESEPFHLFISDVSPDPLNPNQALVFIHHPSEGAAPSDWRDESGKRRRGNREAYLRERWGLVPRNQMLGSKEAGWKGGAHETIANAKVLRAYWFVPAFGELFLSLWYQYLNQIVPLERSSPFAFVNVCREPKGDMYSLSKYRESHAAAVQRIGLVVSKEEGTTDHGHRHNYGRRAKAAGLDREMVRRMMHHSSPDSQDIYTQPTQDEICEALVKGVENLEAGLELSEEIRRAVRTQI